MDWQLIWETIEKQAIALLVLVLVNLLAGVIASIAKGEFRWALLADFLQKTVLPKVGGWFLCEVMRWTIDPEALPEGYAFLTTLAGTAYIAAVLSIAARVVEHLGELGVIPEQYLGILQKIGVKVEKTSG